MLNVRLQPSMLKILVGEKEQVFVIHEGVLTTRSKFFKNAMQKGWKEAEDKIVKLPEDDPTAFELYEQLVYAGHVPGLDDTIMETRWDMLIDVCKAPRVCEDEYVALCQLYVLAEKLQDLQAKNSTTKALLSRFRCEYDAVNDNACLPCAHAINIMYRNTPTMCPGREVLVDLYVWYGGAYAIMEAEEECSEYGSLPGDFLRDVAYKAIHIRKIPREKDSAFHPYRQPDYYKEQEEEAWISFEKRKRA